MVKSRPASLFVGRYQPFHDGHKALIDSVLKTGKPVVVAIRDTAINTTNPYSIQARRSMIRKAFKQHSQLVKIITIPDIDEICYGRDVGYDIRQITLDNKIEKISATDIRTALKPRHPIIWLTGQSGAGKTSLAIALNQQLNGTVLDGDAMRSSISPDLGFSKPDRHEHNLRVARLAKILAANTPVIVSVIAPFRSTRNQIDKLIKPMWVYVKRQLPKESNKPYETPSKPDLIVNTDEQTTAQQSAAVLKLLSQKSRPRNLS